MNDLDWGVGLPEGESSVNSQETDVVCSGGPVRVGRDSFDCPHLLVPLAAGQEVAIDRRSGGVLVVPQTLMVDEHPQVFADLVCTDVRLGPVFEQLARDVCSRIELSPQDAPGCLASSLAEWRDLLRRAAAEVDLSTEIGLRGELEILRRLALVNAEGALRAWRGYRGAVHDFQSGGTVLEVKTSAATTGFSVQIHGFDQLEPPPDQTLFMAFVGLREDDTAESVPDLVYDLIELGLPVDALHERLNWLGFDPAKASLWTGRYRVDRVGVWEVDEAFPGIRPSDVPAGRRKGVTDLSYVLNLDAAPNQLDRGQIERLFSQIAETG